MKDNEITSFDKELNEFLGYRTKSVAVNADGTS